MIHRGVYYILYCTLADVIFIMLYIIKTFKYVNNYVEGDNKYKTPIEGFNYLYIIFNDHTSFKIMFIKYMSFGVKYIHLL